MSFYDRESRDLEDLEDESLDLEDLEEDSQEIAAMRSLNESGSYGSQGSGSYGTPIARPLYQSPERQVRFGGRESSSQPGVIKPLSGPLSPPRGTVSPNRPLGGLTPRGTVSPSRPAVRPSATISPRGTMSPSRPTITLTQGGARPVTPRGTVSPSRRLVVAADREVIRGRPSISNVEIYKPAEVKPRKSKKKEIVYERKDLTLYPYQAKHSREAIDILRKSLSFVSTSKTGSGKTYITGYLYKKLRFNKMIVFGPAKAYATWYPFFKTYDIDGEFYSYNNIAGSVKYQSKSGLIDRYDYVTKGGKNKSGFRPSKKFMDLVDNKLMLVLDESQNIKNVSAKSNAVVVLSGALARRKSKSRVIMLSATPYDKRESVLRYMSAMGIITEKKLYYSNPQDGTITLGSLNQIISAAEMLDPETTHLIEDEYPIYKLTPKTARDFAYDLYTQVIMRNNSRSMIRERLPGESSDHKIVNYYLKITKQDENDYAKAVKAFEDVQAFDPVTGETYYTENNNFAGTTGPLIGMEKAKLNGMARKARDILTADPKAKVIVFINYPDKHGHLNILANQLQDFSPLMLTGATKGKDVEQIKKSFNNDDNRRLIIGTTKTGSVSLSFHDLQGGRRRYMLINPSFDVIQMIQAAGRVDRPGVLSATRVMFVYGPPEYQEGRIIESNAKKSEVIAEALEGEYRNEAVLPSDFPDIVEGSADDFLPPKA